MAKNYGEIVCMATKLFSFSLCNGNATFAMAMAPVSLLQRWRCLMKISKETMTMGCFTKCGDMRMGPST